MDRRQIKDLKKGLLVGDHREVDRVTGLYPATFLGRSLGGRILSKPSYGVVRAIRGDHALAVLRRA